MKTLLHIGAGKIKHKGFINTDKNEMDISKLWPHNDSSVDGIISMCVFQCLLWKDLVVAFTEAYRVLKKGGLMRMGVFLEDTKEPLDRFLYGDNINMFSFDLLRRVLVDRVGFSEIKLCKFRETAVTEFIPVDNRHKRGSSYVEVRK
mgnify:CR=1 FL=1